MIATMIGTFSTTELSKCADKRKVSAIFCMKADDFIHEKYNLQIMQTYNGSKYVMFISYMLLPTIFQTENTLNLQIDEILFRFKQ